MNRKIFSITFVLIGVLVLSGAGCSTKGPADVQKQVEPDGKVTTEECAELFAFAPKIDLRYNDLAVSYPWTLKYYDRMAALEKKYSITQDELSAACKAKSVEPGFNEEVEKQAKKLQ